MFTVRNWRFVFLNKHEPEKGLRSRSKRFTWIATESEPSAVKNSLKSFLDKGEVSGRSPVKP